MYKNVLWQTINAIIEIKNFTNLFPNSKFKIGKTANPQRRQQEHYADGYRNFKIIAEVSSIAEINKLEQILIKYSKTFYKDYIENEQNGGNGSTAESEKYYIYIISK